MFLLNLRYRYRFRPILNRYTTIWDAHIKNSQTSKLVYLFTLFLKLRYSTHIYFTKVICYAGLMKRLRFFSYFNVLSKTWALCCKKGQKDIKERRNGSLGIAKSTCWIAKEEYFTFCSNVRILEGNGQIDWRKEQSTHHRVAT